MTQESTGTPPPTHDGEPVSRVMWKFTLEATDGWQYVEMPEEAVIRHTAMQGALMAFWAEARVPTRIGAVSRVKRAFIVTGTGHSVPEDVVHVGTVLDGAFVWHLWEDEDPMDTGEPWRA